MEKDALLKEEILRIKKSLELCGVAETLSENAATHFSRIYKNGFHAYDIEYYGPLARVWTNEHRLAFLRRGY